MATRKRKPATVIIAQQDEHDPEVYLGAHGATWTRAELEAQAVNGVRVVLLDYGLFPNPVHQSQEPM